MEQQKVQQGGEALQLDSQQSAKPKSRVKGGNMAAQHAKNNGKSKKSDAKKRAGARSASPASKPEKPQQSNLAKKAQPDPTWLAFVNSINDDNWTYKWDQTGIVPKKPQVPKNAQRVRAYLNNNVALRTQKMILERVEGGPKKQDKAKVEEQADLKLKRMEEKYPDSAKELAKQGDWKQKTTAEKIAAIKEHAAAEQARDENIKTSGNLQKLIKFLTTKSGEDVPSKAEAFQTWYKNTGMAADIDVFLEQLGKQVKVRSGALWVDAGCAPLEVHPKRPLLSEIKKQAVFLGNTSQLICVDDEGTTRTRYFAQVHGSSKSKGLGWILLYNTPREGLTVTEKRFFLRENLMGGM